MAKKFLDDVELGNESIRAAVVEFMPYSFAAVNAQSKRFLEVNLLGEPCAAKSRCCSAAACMLHCTTISTIIALAACRLCMKYDAQGITCLACIIINPG